MSNERVSPPIPRKTVSTGFAEPVAPLAVSTKLFGTVACIRADIGQNLVHILSIRHSSVELDWVILLPF